MTMFVEEMNVVALYHSGNRMNTIGQIDEALPYVDEPELRKLLADTRDKLALLSDDEFERIDFDVLLPPGFEITDDE